MYCNMQDPIVDKDGFNDSYVVLFRELRVDCREIDEESLKVLFEKFEKAKSEGSVINSCPAVKIELNEKTIEEIRKRR